MNTIDNGTVNSGNPSTNGCDWVEAHGDYLFNFALGQLRDPGPAEDLVLETLLATLDASRTVRRQFLRTLVARWDSPAQNLRLSSLHLP
jgi:hypothetical protein